MIKIIPLTFLFVIVIHTSGICQTDPFTGSENIIKKSYAYENFSKISLLDIDGATEVEIGDSFKIEINIREKYLPILFVSENNNELQIKFNYTRENNKYISDPRISIKITCPKLEDLYKQGNSSVSINLKNQSKFFLYNEGNGSATLNGIVNELSIKNDGNGKTDAGGLFAKIVTVDAYGNGNVIINASRKATGKRNGNGIIVQKGKAIIENNP